MTPEQMTSELDRANGLLVEKLGKQPFMRLDLTLRDNGRWHVGGAYTEHTMAHRIAGDFADTPDEALASIFAVLNATPDPDVAAKRAWQGKLGKVIDEGHALNLPDDVMQPLRDGSQAMTEFLSAPRACGGVVMKLQSHYVTYVDFEGMGLGHGCDPSSFDDAVDAYAEHRSNGLAACVMRYDPPTGGACGIMVDVTADADEAIRRRLRGRYVDWPAWLLDDERGAA